MSEMHRQSKLSGRAAQLAALERGRLLGANLRLRIPDSGSPLIRRMMQIVKEQQAALIDISKRSGISYATIRSWPSQRRVPNILNFEAVINSLGYEIKIVRRKEL